MLRVETYTSYDPGVAVNSHLIMREKEAILVDAQFLRSEAKKVVEMIKESGKSLKAVFITHSHPDHFMGLEILTKEFPEAKVVAIRQVADLIKNSGQGYIDRWKPVFKDDFADNFVVPEALSADGNELTIEGEKMQVIELGAGESDYAAALYIPSLKTLVAGDVAYNRVHLWLVGNSIEGWLNNIEKVDRIGDIEKVLPGHGEPTDHSVLEVDKKYIRDFTQFISPPTTKDEAVNKIKREYPDYRLPMILELSVESRMK